MKKIGIYVCSLLLAISIVASGREPVETIVAEATIEANAETRIEFEGKDIDLEIAVWDQPQVHVQAVIEFQGRENNRVRDFLDNFENEVKDRIRSTSSAIYIDADFDEPNRVQIGSRHVGIIFGYNEDELRIFYRLKVPRVNNLDIKNSYQDIIITDKIEGDVTIDHYSGELVAVSFNSLDLSMKYGEAEFTEVENLKATLYENDVEIRSVGNGVIEAKYSNLEFQSIGTVDWESYESDFRTQTAGKITGEFKYARIEVLDAVDEVDIQTTYETEFELGKVGRFLISESKYDDITADEVGQYMVMSAYEDKVEISSLGKLKTSSKYTTYDIKYLKGSFELIEGYEGDIEILNLTQEATEVSVDCKYCKLSLRTDNRPFGLSAKLQYGDVSYPDDRIKRNIYIKENSKIEMEVVTNDFKEGDLQITLRGYEVDASID